MIEGMADGALQVRVAGAGAGSRMNRRFDPSETSEVRIYAHGGADTVVARGSAARIRVRVIGGGGRDTVLREGEPRIEFHQRGQDWRPLPSEGGLSRPLGTGAAARSPCRMSR